MFRYWLKNRLFFDFLFDVLFSALFCFVFIFPSYANYSKACAENAIYINTKIDYQIPSPTVTQLEEIEKLNFVNDTFGYYLTKANVTGNSASKINLLMSDTMDSIDMTMFGSDCLISKYIEAENSAFIDQKASDALKVNLGDRIYISILSSKICYTVCGIYNSIGIYSDGAILIEFSGEAKDTYETNVSSKSYSAAFIDASNEQECRQFLNSYIPKGRLKDRSEFASDEAFNYYNNSILSGDYYNEITDFCSQRPMMIEIVKEKKSNLTMMSFVGTAAVGILFFVINEVLRFRKSENNYFSNVLKNKKGIKIYRWLSFTFSVIGFVSFSIVISLFSTNIVVILLPLIVCVVGFFLTHVVNLIQDISYSKK